MRTPAALALLAAAALALAACGESEEEGGPTMRPGENCLRCHGEFTAAGTVYTPGGAAASGVSVSIAGTSGTINLTTNSAGNFYTSAAITYPASVTVGGQGMTAPNGACNSCHTSTGTGRITP